MTKKFVKNQPFFNLDNLLDDDIDQIITRIQDLVAEKKELGWKNFTLRNIGTHYEPEYYLVGDRPETLEEEEERVSKIQKKIDKLQSKIDGLKADIE